MNLKQYLILMSLGTIVCWSVWFIVLGNVDPTDSGWLGFAFFYLSLFLSLAGTFSVIGFFVKQKFSKNDTVIFKHVRHAFRQGILLSILLIISLLLLQLELLNWLTGILLVVLFLILESILLSARKFRNKDRLRGDDRNNYV